MTRTASSERNDQLTAERSELRKIAHLLQQKPIGLADYHAIGEQFRRLSEDEAVAARGSGWRAQAADLLGVSEATLNKCLQFRLTYEEADLPDLEAIGLGWSRLTVALAIKAPQKRHKLLQKAKKEGWDERQLQREFQRMRGGHRGGGRPRKAAKSQGCLADGLDLIRLTRLWDGFVSEVWSKQQESYLPELAKMNEATRENLRRLLDQAAEELKAMLRHGKDAQAAVRGLLDKLPPPQGEKE